MASLPDIGQEISPNGSFLISSAAGHAADLYVSDTLLGATLQSWPRRDLLIACQP